MAATRPSSRQRRQAGLEAWSSLVRVTAALGPRVGHDLEAARELPVAWFDILLALNSAPKKRLRMQDLGDRVVLSRSRSSRIVDELVAAGLVSREADPQDRRGSYAVLTDEGRASFRSASPVYAKAVDEHLTRHLTDEEIAVISGALGRILAAEEPEV